MNRKSKIIIGILVAVIVAAVAVSGIIMWTTKANNPNGPKTITFTVIAENVKRVYTIDTNEQYLRGALEQESLVEGIVSQYGLFVTAVDEIDADAEKEEWWCFTKSGEMLPAGVDTTPISDGDSFEATLTVGYDNFE